MIPLGVLAATRAVATPAPGYQSLAWTTTGLANWAITDGGLQIAVVSGAVAWLKAKASAPKVAGKHYCEITVVSSTADLAIGLGQTGDSTSTGSGGWENAGDGGRMQYFKNGRKRRGGVYADYAASYSAGDVIGLAYDATARTLTAYKNGVSQGLMYGSSEVPAVAHEPHIATYGNGSVGTVLRFNTSLLHLPAGFVGWTP